jgi:hypothetical protein
MKIGETYYLDIDNDPFPIKVTVLEITDTIRVGDENGNVYFVGEDELKNS